MSQPTICLSVARYRPTQDTAPVLQEYRIPYRQDWVVLDALNHIKEHVDESLSYRWSCRMGVCGSCGAMVNGEPKLTCATFLRDYYPGAIRVEPLANFGVIRDLVIEMDDFMAKLRAVKPWILRRSAKPLDAGEYRQTPAQLAAYKQFSMCINCMLCYAACPVYGLEREFIGPAALALAHRYNMDSRDEGKDERAQVAASSAGIWECTFVGECSQVCPTDVDPAAAIQRTKVASAQRWFKSVLMPWAGRQG